MMIREVRKSLLLLPVILGTVVACSVFLPERGGSGQPCLEQGDERCRSGLTCCADGICRESCQGEEISQSDGGGEVTDGGYNEGGQGGDVPISESGSDGPVVECSSDDQCTKQPDSIGVCLAGRCLYVPKEASETICNDGIDNDMDGTTDTADVECGGPTAGECSYETPYDDDGDGFTSESCDGLDCDDTDETQNPATFELVNECNDSSDSDCDDNDDDCSESSFASGVVDVWVSRYDTAAAVGLSDLLLWGVDGWWNVTDALPSSAAQVWSGAKGEPMFIVMENGSGLEGKPGQLKPFPPQEPRPVFKDVWAADAEKRVYAVGCDIAVGANRRPVWFLKDTEGWRELPLPSGMDGYCLMRVVGRGFHRAWAYGIHYNQTSTPILLSFDEGPDDNPSDDFSFEFTKVGINAYGFTPHCLWVDEQENVFIGGMKEYDAVIWGKIDGQANAFVVDVGTETDKKAVDSIFSIASAYDGNSHMWAAVGNKVMFANGYLSVSPPVSPAGWSTEYDGMTDTRAIKAIHGYHPNDIWAVGESGLMLHRDSANRASPWRKGNVFSSSP